MFKWRGERNRITAVFRFQFHATQVSEYGGNGFVLSVVPAEHGKPTAKLEKSTVRENTCYWENPVYETVKFIQDPKTGKIQDKIYYFIISTGSPRGSLVGEFSVNIADYVAATKACSVSFPFKNSIASSHLHVSIQRIQENVNQRDLEENEGLKIKPYDRSLRRHFSNGDVEEDTKTNSIEDQPLRKTASHMVRLNATRRGSNGSDITLSSSDSSSGLNTSRELALRNNSTSKDQTSNSPGYQDQQRPQWELAIVPFNESSTDYLMNSPRDCCPSLRSQIGVNDSVEKLKAHLVALSRRAEVSELELQTLRKQIVKESKKGQDLVREIASLKEEKNALKDECEKLKASRKRADVLKDESKCHFEGDPWTLLEEIREELNYEKDVNVNLRLQLQKTQDSNAELILAVQDLEEMYEKNGRGVSHLRNRSTSGESAVEIEESVLKWHSDDDKEQKALEELVRQHSDAQESYLLEQKIMDLCSELEMYRRDKDELEMQMEQLALDYEILKQENHEFSCRLEQSHLQEQLKMQCEGSGSCTAIKELEAQRRKLENELKERTEEISHCLTTIKDLEARNWSLEEELLKQAEGFEADKEAVTCAQMKQEQRAAQAEEALNESDAIIKELEIKIEKLKNESKKQLEELSDSLATIKELETHNHNLEEELEKRAEGFEADTEALVRAKTEQEQRALKAEEAVTCSYSTIKELETHNHILEEELEKRAEGFQADMEALVRAKTEQEQRALKAEKAVACSNATINELEICIKKLENEITKHSEGSTDTLAAINELEAHIQTLEEELEKQAEGFEADLEAVTRAKVEQERRAIRAEESLRSARWKNANTAARIQDEFKRLSTQMLSSFTANERLASKALTEASELRLRTRHLQDMLQKAHEELQSAKDDYEAKLHELHGQITLKSTQIEQMAMEIEEKTNQVETQERHTDELQKEFSAQQLDVREEIERLASENKSLNEQMEALIKERDLLVKRKTTERDNLEGTSASVKEVGGKSLEELNMLSHLKNETEQAVTNLQSEVEELRAQCDNLKHSLFDDELEKEKLRKQVFQLKADLRNKDEVILSIEKKFKENLGQAVVQDRSKATLQNTISELVQRSPKEVGSKEVATLKEKIKLLEEQIKLKETALETSAKAFLAKEKDLYGKIEELEIRLGEPCQSSPGFGHDKVKKIQEKASAGTQMVCNTEDVTSAGDVSEKASSTSEDSNNIELYRKGQILSDTQSKASNNSGEEHNFDILLKKMVLFKEKNNSMEIELKEMQERYSEISLKFAEVEGERQQLVMKLRNLKNAKKS